MAVSLISKETSKYLERTGRDYFSILYYNMSALALINQSSIRSFVVSAGGGATTVVDEVLSVVVPAGTYLGQVSITLAGAGVTSGNFVIEYDGADIYTAILGSVTVNPTASACFYFQSNGTDALSIDVVGVGANWTSGASTLLLRQIA